MQQTTRTPLIDVIAWRKQRNRFPIDKLQPYWGMQVAWSADGTTVLASALDDEGLFESLAAQGIHASEVVVEFIPDPQVSYL